MKLHRFTFSQVYLIFVLFLPLLASGGEESIPQIPNGVVVTSGTTLKAAQGELVLSIGEQALSIQPSVIKPLSANRIAFVTNMEGMLYTFTMRQASMPIGSSSTTVAAGIVSVTVVNTAQVALDAHVWIQWRHQPLTSHHPDILLNAEAGLQELTISHRNSWNEKWAWRFINKAFGRADQIVYWISQDKGWEQQFYVQSSDLPYSPLKPKSLLGTRHYQVKLDPNKLAFLQAVVPFLPVSRLDYEGPRRNAAN